MIRIYFRTLAIVTSFLLPILSIPLGINVGIDYGTITGLLTGFGFAVPTAPIAFIFLNMAAHKEGALREWVMKKPEPKELLERNGYNPGAYLK